MSSLEKSWQQVQTTQSYSLVTRILLWAGAVGPLLFVVVLLIEGATRPGYNAWHTFGSLLSLGDQGWMQITNFIVCGILTLGFAIGLRQVLHSGKGSVWGPILLGFFGLLLVIAGIFVTDPGQGYPVGVAPLANPTGHGIIHALCGLAIFITLPIATFVMTRRFAGDPNWKGWVLYSLLTGVIMLASFVISQWLGSMDQSGVIQNAPMGLVQRIGIIAGWVWVSLLAIALLRKGRAPEKAVSASSH
ncbi:MAG TPA: DUF998 domain-containing protein [Ktedonobacteraceae bacterium]